MFQRVREMREGRQSGFTLIELLIVIVILAVLAAIVVFSVSGIQNNSKSSACKADVKAIDTAAEAYYAQNNAAVASLGALVTGGFLHSDSSISGNVKNVVDGNGNPIYKLTFVPGSGGANSVGDVTVTTAPTGGC